MKALEILNKYVKEEQLEKVGIIAISKNQDKMHWYHVHENEDLPDANDYEIAIHIG